MLARRGRTLQKTEMPKQSRHRKLKVLEMPSEACAFLITVLLVTVQFEILFFINYVVSTQNTSLLFLGEGAYVTNRMSPQLD
uniref:Uncharacterized protein n=1 Tax=Mandrillus leucophaeus TaxID=9568 RepID=A0A2K5ZX30_MANLE